MTVREPALVGEVEEGGVARRWKMEVEFSQEVRVGDDAEHARDHTTPTTGMRSAKQPSTPIIIAIDLVQWMLLNFEVDYFYNFRFLQQSLRKCGESTNFSVTAKTRGYSTDRNSRRVIQCN